MTEHKMRMKIFGLDEGIIIYEDVKFIRIRSRDYNLLIMEDYVPIIGEIDGKIDVETIRESFNLEQLKGYFMHTNNEFNLIIKEGRRC
ncbi:MAG: hypothetical protein HFG15_01775 [Bacilli bacterium]|jgi:hypothetical protein|nr:hypothetical protein [Bacilli bacterium]